MIGSFASGVTMVSDVAEQAGVEAGRLFAAALAGRQAAVLTGLLAPDVDFRGLTPGRAWEANTSSSVLEILLDHWFEPTDVIEELVAVSTGSVADRHHVSYRLAGHNADGPFVVEQQMYYMIDNDDPAGDRITWMRVLCSGFRPPTS